MNPEFLFAMLPEPVADNFRFAYVGSLLSRIRVNAKQNVYARFGEFFTSQEVVKLGTWASKSFTCPVDEFCGSQALCIAFRKE